MSKRNDDFFKAKKPWSETKDSLLGCYFGDDYMIAKSLVKKYVIKYCNIEKIVYVKRTWRNYFLTIYNPYLTPGCFHIYFVDPSKKVKMHRTAFFRYKDLIELPKPIKNKTEIIERIEL